MTEPAERDTRGLLTLPEQRRSRQNSPNSPTFQDTFTPDPEDNHRTSIGLPSGHRISAQSVDLHHRRSMSQEKPLPPEPRRNSQERESQPNLQTKLSQNYGLHEADHPSHPPRRVSSQKSLSHVRSLTSLGSSSYPRKDSTPLSQTSQSQTQSHQATPTQHNFSQSPSHDLERGPDSDPAAPPLDEEPQWGPSHPCYPHLNPHVPIHSPAYNSTRIIRIRRDWMILGDLAPAYSNIYPEILDPLVPEQEFRYIIDHVNASLIRAFNPFSAASWIDGILGFLTGWFWEDFRSGGVKGELKKLEKWIEDWNRTVGASDGVKIIPLRRTGYMNLDIQIPDPQVRLVDEPGGRTPDEVESNATPKPAAAATTIR